MCILGGGSKESSLYRGKMADYSSELAANTTTLVLAKIGAMFTLGVGSLVLGMLPLIIGRRRFRNRDKCCAISSSSSASTSTTKTSSSIGTSSQDLVTSLLLCFGGGVLLFTTFLHLAPEVRQSVERLQSNGQLMNLGTLSMAELLFCIGFFLVYLVEETVHATLRKPEGSSEDLLYRTVSVRRGNKQANSTSVSTTTISTVTTSATSKAALASASSWQRGKFKYASEEDKGIEQEDTKSCTKTLPDCSTRVEELDGTKNGQTLFVRSMNSVESSIEPCEVKSPVKCPTGEHQIAMKPAADSSVRGLVAVLALSFHAIFEGLAVGLEPSITSVIYLAAAIATHKLVIAFCVGMELYVAGASGRTLFGHLSVFSLVTPLGIVLGLALGHLKNDNLGPTPTILQGMAAGTLLYVVFFEVLARERANEKSGLLQLAAIIVGFMLMLGLQLATAHSHSHSHGHSHGGGEKHADESHDDHKDHDHSEHSKTRPISEAIERITESVAEVVTNAIASSTTANPNLRARSLPSAVPTLST